MTVKRKPIQFNISYDEIRIDMNFHSVNYYLNGKWQFSMAFTEYECSANVLVLKNHDGVIKGMLI